MLKNLVLRRLLIFIIVFNMLFCQTAMAININTSNTVNSEDIVAVFVDDAMPNEEVTILVYSSDITNPSDIQGEDILYIDQLTADENGKVNFLFRLRDGTTAGEKKIAIGSTSSASPTYRHIIVDGVEKEVYSISVQNPKTEYGIGESFDYSTGNVLITYTDESTATIPLNDSRVTISGFDSTYIAENQEVTATVKEKQDSWFVNIIDKNAPTIPEILTVVNVTGSTIELSWTESTDDAKIEKYEVYRNGSKIGETSTTTYVDTGLSLDVKYTYYVIAVDKNGNFSEQSTTISATTALPKINRIVPVTGTAFGGTTKTLSLYAANLNNTKNSVLSVKYRKANAEWDTLNASAITLAETTTDEYKYNISLNMGTWTSAEYEFEFILTDETGGKASYSAVYDIDCQAPAKINNFVATAGEANVLLSWEMGNEIDIVKYIIYRSVDGSSFEKYKEISGRGNTYFTDSSVTIGTKYSYKISAIDGYNQESVLSDVAEATPQKDSTAPNIMSISPVQGTVLTGPKTITVKASDNIGVSSIELQYSIDNGTTFKTLETKNNAATSSFTFDSSKVADGTIQIRAIATDTSGNVSDGQPVYTYIVDNTGPNKISDFKSSSKTYTTITLEWASIEDGDYSYCIVERKSGTSWVNCAKTTTVLGANITGLSPETEYTFRVVAYDKYGNRGEASDEVTVTTEADTESPVITSINPKPASFSSSIAVQITAKDSYKVKKLTIETSTDAKNWTEETLLELDTPVSSKTFSYTLNLSDKSEGVLYVRGVAEDIYGNKSDSSEAAPYVQYNVDKTAPATPNDVELICYGGYLELKWTQGTDSDLKGYNVYRSTSKNSGYSKVASSITKVNYIDSNVSLGQVYYYKVQAIDTAGNIGEFSEVVSGEMLADTEAPVIKSWNYSNGVTIQKTNTLNILATDNNLLSKMTLEYKTAETDWTVLETKTGNQNSYIFKFAVSSLVDGTYSFRAKTTDASGNESNYSNEMTYTFDSTAPKINEVTVTPNEGSITVKWAGNNEQDLAGYYIYRKTTGSYSKVASYSNNGNTSYEFTDANVSYGTNYTYQIETFDTVGNKNTHTTSAVMPLYVYVEPKPDTTKPNITCTIPSTMQQAVEEYFDATRCTDDTEISTYHWDFGDGTTSSKAKSVHSYSELGKYTVTLTVTDTSGNTSTASKTVTVVEKKMAGTLKIRVVDDSGNKVSGAGVFYKLGTDDMVSYATNANGEVTITDYSGTYDVGVYADGYLPAKQSVSIVNNADNSLTIRIIKKEIIVGELTYTRMTFEEIVAAGIDPYAPENQYVYKYEINLTFGTSNYTGTAIKSQSTSNVQPVKITNWTQTSGTASDTTLKGGYVWIIGDDSNNDNYNQSYTSNAKQIVAVLEVPGETSWLKEFFDVQLHIHNQAEESFVIDDCVATLNYPTDGLTLMTDLVDGYSETQTVNIGSIAGQEHKYINWVLRGDEPGDYDISADFSGRLRDFNEEINAKFECSEPIHVMGAEGLKIKVQLEDTIDDGFVYFNMGFANERDEEVTLLNFDIEGIEPEMIRLQTGNEFCVVENEDDIKSIQPGEIFWKYYAVDFKTFATYINPNVNWDLGLPAIGAVLTEYYAESISGTEIPIELSIISDYLFRYYPECLNNDVYNQVFAFCEETIDETLKDVEGGKTTSALVRYALENQIDIISSSIFEKIGDLIGFETEGQYEKFLDELTLEFISSMSNSETIVKDAVDGLSGFVDIISNTYDLKENSERLKLANDLANSSNGRYDVNFSLEIVEKLSENQEKISKALDGAGIVLDFSQVIISAVMVNCANEEIIDILMRNIDENSDLFNSLGRIKNKIGSEGIDYFVSEAGSIALGKIAKKIVDKKISGTSAGTGLMYVEIGLIIIELSSKIIGVLPGNVEVDDIFNTTMSYANTKLFRTSMLKGINKFMGYKINNNYPNNLTFSSEVDDYGVIYNAIYTSMQMALSNAKDLTDEAKVNKDRIYTLESRLNVWEKLTYETYKQLCLANAKSRYGDSFDYSLSENKIVINGLKSDKTETVNLFSNNTDNKTAILYIPSEINGIKVDSISENAFVGRNDIELVVIADGIKNIGANAFNGCTSLNTVILGNSVENIGDCTFKGCSSLTNIALSESITNIGEQAFKDCTKLESIRIPKGVSTIQEETFANNLSLNTVIIMNSESDVTETAFNGSEIITVYGEGNSNLQNTVEQQGVSFSSLAPNLVGIEISKLPANTTVEQNALPNTAGMELLGKYSDGTTKTFTNGWIAYCDSKELGQSEAIVFYSDFTTTYSVEVVEKKSYITTFSSDRDDVSGNAPENITAYYEEIVTLPQNTFAREGYKFAGWLAEVDDEKIFLPEGAEYTVTCDVEFEAVWVGIDMQIGAAVRTASPTGLRFYIRIDTESYNAIKALDDGAKCGTLISPLDYFTDGVYTMEWLSANNRSFLDIENIAFAEENLLYKEYRGVISNIMDKNYNRLFVGRGYIQFTYTNGEKNTIYTDFSQEDNARAVAAVAKKALEDTSANYTEAQIAVLEQFAASYEEE